MVFLVAFLAFLSMVSHLTGAWHLNQRVSHSGCPAYPFDVNPTSELSVK